MAQQKEREPSWGEGGEGEERAKERGRGMRQGMREGGRKFGNKRRRDL